jgi:hypothetical protein
MTERLCGIQEVVDVREALKCSAYMCVSRLCRFVSEGICDPVVRVFVTQLSGYM